MPPNAQLGPFPNDGSPDGWGRVAAKLGIQRAVAFAPFPHQCEGDPNEWLIGVLETKPGLIGFATLCPLDTEAPRRLRRLVQEYGFRGAKLHPPMMHFRIDDPRAMRYYEVAEELRIPLVFHTGVHGWRLDEYRPRLLDRVADRFPDLPILMAHVGGMAQFDEALAVLHNRPNVYAELAQTRRFVRGYCWRLSDERIDALIRTVGPDRMVYGCDWPWVPEEEITKDIERIQSWPIAEDEKQMIFGGTLKKILSQRDDVLEKPLPTQCVQEIIQ